MIRKPNQSVDINAGLPPAAVGKATALARRLPPRLTLRREMKEGAIEDCEERLRRAQLSGDVEALDRLLDDALVFTALDGSVVGKNDDLELHRSGRLRISRMEPRDFRVMHLGTVAVVSVEMDAEALVDGVRSSGRLRYTRVWTQRPEGWRIVAGHMTIVPTKT